MRRRDLLLKRHERRYDRLLRRHALRLRGRMPLWMIADPEPCGCRGAGHLAFVDGGRFAGLRRVGCSTCHGRFVRSRRWRLDGAALRAWRKTNDVSLREAAARWGASAVAVSSWEHGRHGAPSVVLMEIER